MQQTENLVNRNLVLRDNMSMSDSTASPLELERDGLQETLNEMLAIGMETASGGRSRADRRKAVAAGITKLLKKTIKRYVWRTEKFCAKEHHIARVVNKVWHNLPDQIKNSNVIEEREWKIRHHDKVASLLNAVRVDVVSDLRKEALKYMGKNRGAIPSVEAIQNCATRKNSLEDNPQAKAQRDVFVWYIDKLLPKACGNRYEWPAAKRPWHRVSEYHYDGVPNKKHVTAGTEAFIVVCWENYLKVWQKQYEHTQTSEGENLPKPRKKGAKDYSPEEQEYLAKWTSSDAGSTVFGGWHKDAKDYFIKWAKEVREARAHERCAPVEERGMLDLRAKMGITGAATEAEYLRSKKRRSTQTARSQEEDIEFYEEV